MQPCEAFSHPAIAQEILRCEVGSSAHGVSLPGTDDLDLMSVAVERPEFVLGLGNFETWIYRTAALREGKVDARSQPGDVDLTVHSLRKFSRLAAKGNPTILMLLFSPTMLSTPWGDRLRGNASLFASKEAGKHFLGYMQAQRERMLGLRGQKDVKRPELVEKYGFDTKYAMHMLRLGFQGIEFVATGRMSVPMPENIRNFLIQVRTGVYTQERVIEEATYLEQELKTRMAKSVFPDECDIGRINNLLTNIYKAVWASKGLL